MGELRKLLICYLSLFLSAFAVKAINVELILDFSRSMSEEIDNQVKIEVAKEAVEELLKALPEDILFALRIYGHRASATDPQSCQDSELIQTFNPLTPETKKDIKLLLRTLQPKGKTPLVYSLLQAKEDLAALEGDSAIILVTDGEETCGGNLREAIDNLVNAGIKVYVIGFGIAAKESLEAIATETGGVYYDVQQVTELAAALMSAAREIVEIKQEPAQIDVSNADGTLSITSLHLRPDVRDYLALVIPHLLLDCIEGVNTFALHKPSILLEFWSEFTPCIYIDKIAGAVAIELEFADQLKESLATIEPMINVTHATGIMYITLTPPQD